MTSGEDRHVPNAALISIVSGFFSSGDPIRTSADNMAKAARDTAERLRAGQQFRGTVIEGHYRMFTFHSLLTVKHRQAGDRFEGSTQYIAHMKIGMFDRNAQTMSRIIKRVILSEYDISPDVVDGFQKAASGMRFPSRIRDNYIDFCTTYTVPSSIVDPLIFTVEEAKYNRGKVSSVRYNSAISTLNSLADHFEKVFDVSRFRPEGSPVTVRDRRFDDMMRRAGLPVKDRYTVAEILSESLQPRAKAVLKDREDARAFAMTRVVQMAEGQAGPVDGTHAIATLFAYRRGDIGNVVRSYSSHTAVNPSHSLGMSIDKQLYTYLTEMFFRIWECALVSSGPTLEELPVVMAGAETLARGNGLDYVTPDDIDAAFIGHNASRVRMAKAGVDPAEFLFLIIHSMPVPTIG